MGNQNATAIHQPFENEEHKGNEETQVTYEAQDQVSVHDESTSDDSEPVAVGDAPPLNDTSIIENGCIQDEQTFTDNQTSENHLLSESEPSHIEEQDAQSIHGFADEVFNEDHKWSTEASINYEPNSDETVGVHPTINMTEEKSSEEAVATSLTMCTESCLNEHFETDDGSVEVHLSPTDKGSGPDPDHTETSHLLKVVQENSIGDSNVNVEETTMPVADTHDSKGAEFTSIQNDMLVVGEQTIMMESQLCIEEMSRVKSETHKSNGQMDETKDAKENFVSLPDLEPHIMNADTHSVVTEPAASNGIHDIDELSEKNLHTHSKSGKDKIRCLVIAQEPEPTKPVIEGFIFADHLRDGEVMLDSLKCNLQIEKCPSFNFDIKNDSRPKESNHTPLMYQNKPPMRSLSSSGNNFLHIPSAKSDKNGHGFCETYVKEKTIILERMDSEKSKEPLSGPEEDKHQRDEPQNGHLNGEMLQLAKTRQKNKTRPSFFSSCVCCVGIDQLNADF